VAAPENPRRIPPAMQYTDDLDHRTFSIERYVRADDDLPQARRKIGSKLATFSEPVERQASFDDLQKFLLGSRDIVSGDEIKYPFEISLRSSTEDDLSSNGRHAGQVPAL
jgi:hypothetical protein